MLSLKLVVVFALLALGIALGIAGWTIKLPTSTVTTTTEGDITTTTSCSDLRALLPGFDECRTTRLTTTK